jgi:hypothetical protein
MKFSIVSNLRFLLLIRENDTRTSRKKNAESSFFSFKILIFESSLKRDGRTTYSYESDIIFLIRPSGGPVWFTGVSNCGYMRYHGT